MPERYLGRTFGKYRIESLIGSGGFAWVFKGFDPELEIPVAIKVLKPQYGSDQTLVDRFRREASTAAKLSHPNIIKIFTVGKEGDAVYFVMDYLPTGLADKLETTPTLPEDYVLRVGIDVARALGFAHRQGVIHRDIKVDNILFDSHGNAVVADFGIARAVSGYTQHTGTNMVVGTPQYFAPEQARAKPLDGRADIYSLGVTLFRASTGRLPFEGDDWYEIARQHVEDPPPAPRTFAPALTPEFEMVMLRCLAKSVDDRPSTGEELAEHLESIRQQHRDPTQSRTITVPAQLTNTMVTPALPPRRITEPPRRRMFARASVLVPSVMALMAASFVAWKFLDGRFAAATTTNGADSSAAATIPPFPDSTGSTAGATKRDSATPTSRLTITVPTDAELRVNGSLVSTINGVYRIEGADSGRYVLHAKIPAIDGCPTASRDTTIILRGPARKDVPLHLRPCGTLEMLLRTEQATQARYTLTSVDPPGLAPLQGALPLRKTVAVILPVGKWSVVATNPMCQDYSDNSVTITAGVKQSVTITPFCPRGSKDD